MRIRGIGRTGLALVLMASAALAGVAFAQAPKRRQADPKLVYAVPIAGAPVKGKPDARITVVMFGEFKCPYCAKAHETLRELEKKYPGEVRVVFHHMIVHPAARPIARMGAAAGAQGKFWPWADKVWAGDWKKLDEAGARQLAIDVGCDGGKLDAFIASGDADAAVDAGIALAARFAVTGTPAFFINGRFLSGAQPIDKFTALVDEVLLQGDAWAADRKAQADKQGDKQQNSKRVKKGGDDKIFWYDDVLAHGLPEVPTTP